VNPHWLLVHDAPPCVGVAHALVHELQCVGSLVRSAHAPLQLVSEPQSRAHAPFRQTSLLAHAFEQVPQCPGSFASFVSHPSEAMPLQSPQPASHTSTPHSLDAQV
jgi:hypothetical protein